MTAEVQPFEAEVGRVLDLVINSLYQHREIFLRELISNGSDACDRLRYLSLSEPKLQGDDPELKILITPDREAGTLTVFDTGIGMSRDDLVENLGTIARSGTQRFVHSLSGDQAKDLGLIGQFGVGFYSAFMVADRVEVRSRKAGESNAWSWRSDGRNGFSVEAHEGSLPRGTSVILHLRDDAKEFLDEWRIRQVARSYSDHIPQPILLVGDAKKKSGGEDEQAAEPAKPEQINEASALWTRPKNEITEEQYREFYHHVAHALDEPWARLHVQAEGVVSYKALLFIPSTQPFDLHDPHRRHGVKLYVRRVFITDDLEGLMPRYLRFVRGVVDSEDLQLNVSRETLQHSSVLAKIRKALVKRILDELERQAKAEGGAAYDKFWEGFGPVLKEGIYEDHEQRERLMELARFRSTAGDGWTSLAAYVERMKPGQDAVFTISGESIQTLRSSPQLEACRAKGVEVLLLADPIDDFWLPTASDYKGKPFRSLTRGDVDLSKIEGGEDQADGDQQAERAARVEGAELDRLIALFKARVGDRVKDVRPSERLTESAVCLVADELGMDMRLERFLKQHHQLEELSKRVLEINPRHELIRQMAALAAEEGRRAALGELAELLLDQARIVEGEPLPDPGAFSRRMSAYLAKGLAA
jgi:molecular chaperone HtpG